MGVVVMMKMMGEGKDEGIQIHPQNASGVTVKYLGHSRDITV